VAQIRAVQEEFHNVTADQAAGESIGFLNPTLHAVELQHPAAFNDIVPAANPDATAVIRVDYANTVNKSSGYVVSLRAIDYQAWKPIATARATVRRGSSR
jgi:hypothetical protein